MVGKYYQVNDGKGRMVVEVNCTHKYPTPPTAHDPTMCKPLLWARSDAYEVMVRMTAATA